MSDGPWLPITSARTLRACSEFPARADDVFICSYPKSGTTWCQNLVARILTRSREDEPTPLDTWSHVSDVSPFFEIDPHWDHDAETSSLAARVIENHRRFVRGRRVFNTHLPLSHMPRVVDEDGKKTRRLPKIVYVARDGRDCAVSFWHHLKSQSVEDGGWQAGWDAFFDAWIEGSIAFGSWFDHLESWRDAPATRFFSRPGPAGGIPETAATKEDENERAAAGDCQVLVIRYEDMKTDLRGVARAVANHVDPSRPLREHELDAVVRECAFDAMKRDIGKYQPKSVRWIDASFSFVRRGGVGSFEERFSNAQKTRFKEKAAAKFGAGGLRDAPMWRQGDAREAGV